MKKIALSAAVCLALSGTAMAQGIDTSKVYFGGGLGMNSLSGWDDAMGFQAFAGLPLDHKLGNFNTAVEVGYMSSGDFEYSESFSYPCFDGFGFTTCTDSYTQSTSASGLWANGVATMPINQQLDFIGRVGLDLGDDDGLMFGAGVGYKLNRQMELRGEYVIRQEINSLQANFVYRP